MVDCGFPAESSANTVNVGARGSVSCCMGVTNMTKEQRREIDLTDEETGENELPRTTVVDPKQEVARG
jgi:hypothetical protein